MNYIPEFIFRGNKGKYWKNRENAPNHKDKLLITLWKKFNKDIFEDSLIEPEFIIFSKFCFKNDRVKTHGYFQFSLNPLNRDCGIYISFEKYYMLGITGIENTLKHEMVHQYLHQNKLNSRDNSVDFVYYMGWFRVSLKTKSIKATEECKRFIEYSGVRPIESL